MRTLVTGASGLVGSAITGALEAAGHEAVSLSRHPPPDGERAVVADIASAGLAELVSACQSPCEAIVHAAASLSMAPSDPQLALTNCLGTQQVLELAGRWETKVFVFMSSVPVIGRPRSLPVTEDHPVDPLTPYHATKLYGEHLVRMAGREDMAGMTLRLTAPVGRGLPPTRLLASLLNRAQAGEPLEVAGDGSRRQDYVDTRDIADAVVACLERPHTTLLNIASGRSVSNLELAELVKRVVGSSSAVNVGKHPDPEQGVIWDVSIKRAAGELGYVPERSLEDSIATLNGAVMDVD